MGIWQESFFPCRKRFEVVGSLAALGYIMIKLHNCIFDVYLRRLIRVVAMSLKMDIILLPKLYHPSNGSSFTSVSTYLQKNTSGSPSSNPNVVRVRDSYMGPIMPLSPHREGVVSL